MSLDFQKEKGQMMKTIKELKIKNETDNEHWAAKIDEMRQEHIEELSQLNVKN